ncbi:MAG: NUDIX hydrolase [Deltaproteobacteria bacterium]|nr:NUDIX hydrolase [Deltaproteobacteria bacterium]
MTGPARPRDAASLVVVRGAGQSLRVLMGRRAPRHRFMPDVWVFPGGGVEHGDHHRPLLRPLRRAVARPLEQRWSPARVRALAIAAVRETWEETGLAVGDVRGGQFLPDLAPLRYLGRAITPAQSEIRYHARFFVTDAGAARGRLRGNGELMDLSWLPIAMARRLPIIDVTEEVLDRVARVHGERRRSRSFFIHYRLGERCIDDE